MCARDERTEAILPHESMRSVIGNLMSIFRRTPPPSSPPGTPQAPPPAASGPAPKLNETSRAAPEPLAIVLPAIAALGAITSIAAVAYLAEDRTSTARVSNAASM
jgi:hypothetical protein